jgi:hypothetical protein
MWLMTEIEAFLYESNEALLAANVGFADSTVTITVVSSQSRQPVSTLLFSGATIRTVWFDQNESTCWPLDIVGFESFPTGENWRFVLNCSTVEFSWISAWPRRSQH